jgi:hypothetical protein
VLAPTRTWAIKILYWSLVGLESGYNFYTMNICWYIAPMPIFKLTEMEEKHEKNVQKE